ncbi:TetR/AcrR family transcriptional regulator [Streptomyces malaysiensis subsp. malaysiensis]|uniref:TetR/AcrR family transcriptional regulator n=1 Tax=Streptomyces malaysiensis TaxID=92644 RepID=UPI0024BFB2C8|nr:TetR/AcrR family transcriptional regulator [Streptomyces sp. NA07423]WHX23872.1 TetR/AcrR family transcriptional regulator [Streptomyces sp. NA07423]
MGDETETRMSVEQVEPANSRRQRRWQDVHDRLYDAACELFLESDFVSTSVDEIAERADVARKTAYNHFPRKRDLISEWGRRRRLFVQGELSEEVVATHSFEDVLRHYFRALVKINQVQRPLTIRMLMGWRESGGPFDVDPHLLVEVFRDITARAVDRGELRASTDPARVATILYSCYFGILYEWVAGSDQEAPFDLAQAYTQLLDLTFEGLLERPA